MRGQSLVATFMTLETYCLGKAEVFMFCPKCGSQNPDETKYCRGCGADLSGVLTVIEGRIPDVSAVAEKQIDLFSSGLRGVMIGTGFLIVSVIAFAISVRLSIVGLFALAFAFYGLATGISRLVQANALKRLQEPKTIQPTPVLTPGQVEYIKPAPSAYETDELAATPLSITEHTTTHLEMDPAAEEFGSSKK